MVLSTPRRRAAATNKSGFRLGIFHLVPCNNGCVRAPGHNVLADAVRQGAGREFGALLIGLAFRLRREQPEVRADIARAA